MFYILLKNFINNICLEKPFPKNFASIIYIYYCSIQKQCLTVSNLSSFSTSGAENAKESIYNQEEMEITLSRYNILCSYKNKNTYLKCRFICNFTLIDLK